MKTALAVTLCLLAMPALAQQRICVAPFSGPRADEVETQFTFALCSDADCLSLGKVMTAGKPDWKKAKKERLEAFVLGTVTRKGKKASVQLFLADKPGAPKPAGTFTLEGDELTNADLNLALAALAKLGVGRPAPPPKPTTPLEPAKPPPDSVKPPVATAPPKETPPTVVAAPEPPLIRPRAPALLLEVGSGVLARRYGYSTAGTDLRPYGIGPFALPRLSVQLYPLAFGAREGLLTGLGLEVSAAADPLLKTRIPESATQYPTSVLQLDAGARFRFFPLRRFPVSVAGFAGVRYHVFTVGAASDGSAVDALPNLAYLGLRVGVGVEWPFLEERFAVFGHFAVVPIFSSRQIISSAFFSRGRNVALEGAGGVAVTVLPRVQLRLSFDVTQYQLAFRRSVTDAYVADGAYDLYLGGTAAVRLKF